MPIGQKSDFTIYDEQVYAGMIDVLQQETEAFNAQSNNAIRLVSADRKGDFYKESFFDEVQNAIRRRPNNDVTDSDPDKLTSTEQVDVKLNRYWHLENTLNSLRKIASDEEEFSFLVGQAIGKAKAADYLNTALLALVTCVTKSTDTYIDQTGQTGGDENLQYTDLPTIMQKFGDKAGNLIAWVMHSKPFFDLVGDSLNYDSDRVAGAFIFEGNAGTAGKPVIVTDSPDLIDPTGGGTSPSVASYYTFALTSGAAVIEESEEEELLDEVVGGKKNLIKRLQGEHAYNLGVKGYSYTSATENPDDATLGTAGNWTNVKNDVKLTAGVCIETL